jgi:hypothetical protein
MGRPLPRPNVSDVPFSSHLPALATEVTLSAVILGRLLTTLSLQDYVSDRRFWEYFGNILPP